MYSISMRDVSNAESGMRDAEFMAGAALIVHKH